MGVRWSVFVFKYFKFRVQKQRGGNSIVRGCSEVIFKSVVIKWYMGM